MNIFYLILLIFIAIPNQLFGLGEGLGGHEGEDGFVLIDHPDAPTEPLHLHHDTPVTPHADPIATNPHDRTPAPIERVISDIPVNGGDNGTVKVDNSGNDGSGSVVVDPTAAKDVIADVDGGQTISGGASDIPDRVIGTHQKINAEINIKEKEIKHLSFDEFLKNFDSRPEAFETYLKEISEYQTNITTLKERAEKALNATAVEKCDALLQELKDAKKAITKLQTKLNESTTELNALTKTMRGPKYKFKAADLTKLTKLFDDSLDEKSPLVGRYIRDRIRNLMETIIKNNKGLGIFQKSSLRSIAKTMKDVEIFLNKFDSKEFYFNTIDMMQELTILSKTLNAGAKKGNLGFSKIRKKWLEELKNKLQSEVSFRTLKKPNPIGSRPKNTTPSKAEPENTTPSKAEEVYVETTTGTPKTLQQPIIVYLGSRPEKQNPLTAEEDIVKTTTGKQKTLQQPTTVHSSETIEPVEIERKKPKSTKQNKAKLTAQKTAEAAAKALAQAQADEAAAQAAEALAAKNKSDALEAEQAKVAQEKAVIAEQEATRATAAAIKAQQQATAAATAAPSVVEPAPYNASQLKGAKVIVDLNKGNPAEAAKKIANLYPKNPEIAAALIKELLPGQNMPQPKKSVFSKFGKK